MSELEAIVRSFLGNAAARSYAARRAEPEVPSVDYRAGFAAGKESGEVAALALVLSSLTGESVNALIEEAEAEAAVDVAMPFELRLEALDGESDAGADPPPPLDLQAENELVPCPTCWLPADVIPPPPFDTNPRSRCPRGHENTLVPAVLEHLRTLMGPELDESAG